MSSVAAPGTARAGSAVKEAEAGAKEAKGFATRAFKKFSNDWTMNLAAMLAYNVLTSFFPLTLAIITLLAYIPSVSGGPEHVASQLNTILPSNIRTQINIANLVRSVNSSLGLLSLISLIGLLWSGMNLFGAIESAFAIIFRVKTRNFFAQKLMSVLMIFVFAFLITLSFASTFLLSAATTTLGKILPSFFSGPFGLIIGYGTTLISLFVLFVAIYTVVPNIPVRWRFAWPGAVVAAIGMAIVNNVFPAFAAHFLGSGQYGSAALAAALVVITWFWFFSVLLLVGAQINSLKMGIGYWEYDLSRVLMDQKIPTKGGAPTAIDALSDKHGPEVFETPVGLARDSVETEQKDTAGQKQNAPGNRPPQNTSAPPKDHNVNNVNTSPAAKQHLDMAQKSSKIDERAAKPRSAGEMPADMVATGIGEGGVAMAPPDTTAGGLHGLIVVGAVVGLVQGVLSGIRRRQG
ncbi:MAG: YihY/virulence factor BrkB family protein [Chloroflexi bacterium]|nr:YihY/virulence factor BrkB family protein [Chloroflexota bacterium]